MAEDEATPASHRSRGESSQVSAGELLVTSEASVVELVGSCREPVLPSRTACLVCLAPLPGHSRATVRPKEMPPRPVARIAGCIILRSRSRDEQHSHNGFIARVFGRGRGMFADPADLTGPTADRAALSQLSGCGYCVLKEVVGGASLDTRSEAAPKEMASFHRELAQAANQ
jgi:hypothetical protein